MHVFQKTRSLFTDIEGNMKSRRRGTLRWPRTGCHKYRLSKLGRASYKFNGAGKGWINITKNENMENHLSITGGWGTFQALLYVIRQALIKALWILFSSPLKRTHLSLSVELQPRKITYLAYDSRRKSSAPSEDDAQPHKADCLWPLLPQATNRPQQFLVTITLHRRGRPRWPVKLATLNQSSGQQENFIRTISKEI